MKVCPRCQKVTDDDASYCPRCGAKLDPVFAEPPTREEVESPVMPTSNGMSIAGLVFGILVSIAAPLLAIRFTVFELLVIPGGVVGIILSAKSIRRSHDSRSKIGLVLNIIGTAIALLAFAYWLLLVFYEFLKGTIY